MAPQQTTPDAPSHIHGVPRGEDRSGRSKYLINGQPPAQGPRKAHDATGINACDRAPIDRRMPNLPPA
jgi:hypothetical protein